MVSKEFLSSDFKYENFNAPVAFTGGLLLAADFIKDIVGSQGLPETINL